jgi:two-component system phosphate regulon sensor histidine kinase PhoR
LIEVVRNHQLVDLFNKSQVAGDQLSIMLDTSPDRLFIQGIATPLHQAVSGNTLLVFQDLTRLRRLEMVRRDFVSNVSHELRTPLASLKALVNTLRGGALDDPPAAQHFLERMEIEVDAMTQMTEELLELARTESGRVPLQMASISVADLVAPPTERLRPQAERAGLTLAIDLPDDLPDVLADRERIQQVMSNLVHNAIKFTPPGGKVAVSAARGPGEVWVSVTDDGVGIDAADVSRVFERFYKADRARSGGGTGLGLSIAKHIVAAHHGSIWAKSPVPNRPAGTGPGTRISFSLPIECKPSSETGQSA